MTAMADNHRERHDSPSQQPDPTLSPAYRVGHRRIGPRQPALLRATWSVDAAGAHVAPATKARARHPRKSKIEIGGLAVQWLGPYSPPRSAPPLARAASTGGDPARWRERGSSARCGRRHVVRYAPLLVIAQQRIRNRNTRPRKWPQRPTDIVVGCFRSGRIAPSAQSIQWPSQGGYEPKGHELGFTEALLLSDSPALSRWRQAVCRLLGAKRCRSSIS